MANELEQEACPVARSHVPAQRTAFDAHEAGGQQFVRHGRRLPTKVFTQLNEPGVIERRVFQVTRGQQYQGGAPGAVVVPSGGGLGDGERRENFRYVDEWMGLHALTKCFDAPEGNDRSEETLSGPGTQQHRSVGVAGAHHLPEIAPLDQLRGFVGGRIDRV